MCAGEGEPVHPLHRNLAGPSRVELEYAIAVCDDIMAAGLLSPALTTLMVPKYDIGARMLLDRISGRSGERVILARAYRPPEGTANT